jgi:hypothetical protein
VWRKLKRRRPLYGSNQQQQQQQPQPQQQQQQQKPVEPSPTSLSNILSNKE